MKHDGTTATINADYNYTDNTFSYSIKTGAVTCKYTTYYTNNTLATPSMIDPWGYKCFQKEICDDDNL